MRARGRSGKYLVAAITAWMAVLATPGAGSASAAGTAVRAGRPSGLYRPSSASTLAGVPGVGRLPDLGNGPARPLFGTSGGSGRNGASRQCPECSPPLFYAGGPVMHAVTTHVIEWVPTGYKFPLPPGYVTGFEQFLSDLEANLGQSGNISAVLKQYSDVTGPALSSLAPVPPLVDNSAYPASDCPVISGASACLMESDLTTELAKDITGHRLAVNLDQSYIVLLPKGVDKGSIIVTLLLAFLLLHEPFTRKTACGGSLILLGIAVLTWK